MYKKEGCMNTLKRTIAVLIMAFCLPAAGYCEMHETEKAEPVASCQADMHTLLNAYSAFADEYFNSVLCSLRVLSSTSEVRSGRWEVMEGLLEEFDKSGVAVAAVWYAMPDGSYYTVEKGLTGEKLADRPYFPALVAGSEVKGALVISRSTGKRASVFAVPVRTGDRITGALGVSLSMDDVSRTLTGKMELPKNLIFYSLDSQGRTSLHARPELVFEYPSDIGSETLKEAVNKMMSESEGVVSYEFQGKKTVYFKKSPLTGWVYALGIITKKE